MIFTNWLLIVLDIFILIRSLFSHFMILYRDNIRLILELNRKNGRTCGLSEAFVESIHILVLLIYIIYVKSLIICLFFNFLMLLIFWYLYFWSLHLSILHVWVKCCYHTLLLFIILCKLLILRDFKISVTDLVLQIVLDLLSKLILIYRLIVSY